MSEVETNVLASNQHEFNGVEGLRNILGEPEGKTRYEARFLYLTDYDDRPVVDDGFLTWYDARQKARIERQVMRQEYRLYFPANIVSQCANSGDVLVIAKRRNNTLLAIVAEAETTIAQQIVWLFGFSDLSHPGFSVREELETEQDRIEFASRFILENIEVSVEIEEKTYLDRMLDKFNGNFPEAKEFSSYARSTLPDLISYEDQDAVLMAWMEREEILFRTLENHIISEKLSQNFNSFMPLALSIINRRKSRAGLALENHLATLFQECGVKYSKAPFTENRSKPDFIFPGKSEYHNLAFDALNLTMLGVKFTCKDRWRQVLTEADRIDRKHLLTLEAAISKNQTDAMESRNLQLVLPKELHKSCSREQQSWLMSVSEFTEHVLSKQK